MKFSYNILKKYVDSLPSPKKLAEEVGVKSFELEGMEDIYVNGQKDTLIDWDILPNRSSDCLCYLGMAKEISAVFDLQFSSHMSEYVGDMGLKTSDYLSLDIADETLVNRAAKRLAVDVMVGESPQWLKDFLETVGQKSINNVVDITNYVMWITGQPVHAFDYDKLSGSRDHKNVSIKFAKNEEKIVDLSGDEHDLQDTMLVIHDGEQPLDIAGIKGGKVSEVDYETKRIILSAVNFNFENIRTTSKKLKLQTDASKRFENDVPINKIDWAMNLMSELMSELTSAKVSSEILDITSNVFEQKIILLQKAKVDSVLGVVLDAEDICSILSRLDLGVEKDGSAFLVTIPIERLDLNIPEDIIEEIARLHGYEKIKNHFPQEGFSLPRINRLKVARNRTADVLTSLGFFEVQGRTIVNEGEVKLLNPLTSEATALRKNLLDQLKTRVEKNLSYTDEPKLFEIGKIFIGYENNSEERIVNEIFSFAGVIGKKKIKEKQREEFFLKTKGYIEKVFETLSIKNIKWKVSDSQANIADLWTAEKKIGFVGVNFWEIDFEELMKNIDESVHYRKVSKYPSIKRDVAVWGKEDTQVAQVETIIKGILPPEAVVFNLFDIYRDVEQAKVSFAFRIVFQSDNETLSDSFANSAVDKAYAALQEAGFVTR